MLAATRPLLLNYDSHYVVDPDRVDAQHIGRVERDLASSKSEFSGAAPLERNVQIALSPVLGRYSNERSQAETLLGSPRSGSSPARSHASGCSPRCRTSGAEGRPALSRTRGASPYQLLAAQAAEGLLICGAGRLRRLGGSRCLLSTAAGARCRGGWRSRSSRRRCCCRCWRLRAPRGGRSARASARTSSRAARRRGASTVEALIVVAAGLGVYLLRRRGRLRGRRRRIRPLSRRRAGAARPGVRDRRVAPLPVAARSDRAGRAARARDCRSTSGSAARRANRTHLAAADRARARTGDRDVRSCDVAHARLGSGALVVALDRRRPARRRVPR